MSQVDVATSVGYVLKRATWALRTQMDAALRDCGLRVPQYSCLELLRQRPGISNAELARGVFSSRQATHQLLAGLRRSGLVEVEGEGRGTRLTLTSHGATVLDRASTAVAAVEQQMVAGLDASDRMHLHRMLQGCADALDDDADG